MKYAQSLIQLGATALTVSVAGVSSAALAEGVDAGSLIENTATATYDGGAGSVTVDSNTVTVRVDELLDVTTTSLDAGPISAAPGEVVLTFEVTNTGNGPEAFELTANPTVPGNEFETVIESIAVDTNENGVYDEGVDEILTGPETTSSLAADDAITVFVIATVPSGVADGDQSQVQLTAAAQTGTGTPGTVFAGAGVGGADAVVGTTAATASATGSLAVGITTVDLTKSATIADPFGGDSAVPGAVVTFTIVAEVAGSGSVDDLVVADAIPTDTTYVAGTLALGGASLTDAAGDDAGQASNASGISVDLGTVSGGTSQTITFDVTIN
ncbi:hypothetical protein [Erythrobacter rubeus]|uniref:DUF11 domain-containing protein n=1 Tax=Erythrobacter rubeus TaxID=2760803 RepID=A0ABR8KMU7_9SPHN|nr:hypothetical protein [Erythrobacter rubeus]MBD2841892.1 hypothetical protein [Erythrobacter rubeus]